MATGIPKKGSQLSSGTPAESTDLLYAIRDDGASKQSVVLPVSDFATAAQGAKGDTALQRGANLSELTDIADAIKNLGLPKIVKVDVSEDRFWSLVTEVGDVTDHTPAFQAAFDYASTLVTDRVGATVTCGPGIFNILRPVTNSGGVGFQCAGTKSTLFKHIPSADGRCFDFRTGGPVNSNVKYSGFSIYSEDSQYAKIGLHCSQLSESQISDVLVYGSVIVNPVTGVIYYTGPVIGATWTPKRHADCATTGNITLSGEQVIDGFQTALSRVLVKDQTLPAQNGLWLSGAGAWTRVTDMDTWAEAVSATAWVESGTVNQNTTWTTTAVTGGTLDTTSIVWAASFRSIGIQVDGRQCVSLLKNYAFADYPFMLGGTQYDHGIFRDNYAIGLVAPLWSVDKGAGGLSNCVWEGDQAWVAGGHGFFWNAPPGSGSSTSLSFNHVRTEQGGDEECWSFFMSLGSIAMNVVQYNDCQLDLVRNGIYQRKVVTTQMNAVKHAGTTVGRKSIDIEAFNSSYTVSTRDCGFSGTGVLNKFGLVTGAPQLAVASANAIPANSTWIYNNNLRLTYDKFPLVGEGRDFIAAVGNDTTTGLAQGLTLDLTIPNTVCPAGFQLVVSNSDGTVVEGGMVLVGKGAAVAPTLVNCTAGIINTDTNLKFCVFRQDANRVRFKNRLGFAVDVTIRAFFRQG